MAFSSWPLSARPARMSRAGAGAFGFLATRAKVMGSLVLVRASRTSGAVPGSCANIRRPATSGGRMVAVIAVVRVATRGTRTPTPWLTLISLLFRPKSSGHGGSTRLVPAPSPPPQVILAEMSGPLGPGRRAVGPWKEGRARVMARTAGGGPAARRTCVRTHRAQMAWWAQGPCGRVRCPGTLQGSDR